MATGDKLQERFDKLAERVKVFPDEMKAWEKSRGFWARLWTGLQGYVVISDALGTNTQFVVRLCATVSSPRLARCEIIPIDGNSSDVAR